MLWADEKLVVTVHLNESFLFPQRCLAPVGLPPVGSSDWTKH